MIRGFPNEEIFWTCILARGAARNPALPDFDCLIDRYR
jgi:hypothetical protein